MKNQFLMNAVFVLLMSTIFFTSCQTSGQKVDDAQTKVDRAKADLKEVEKNAAMAAQKAASAEEWRMYKADAESKIKNNEAQIAALRQKMKSNGKAMYALYVRRTDSLEMRNKNLLLSMDKYEKNQSDWESFKTEFSHDMNELGTALKDFTINNKK